MPSRPRQPRTPPGGARCGPAAPAESAACPKTSGRVRERQRAGGWQGGLTAHQVGDDSQRPEQQLCHEAAEGEVLVSGGEGVECQCEGTFREFALLPNRRGTHPEEATEAGVSRQRARVGREEVPPDGLGVHDAALCAGGRGNREAGDTGCQSVSASHGCAVCQGQQVSRPDWAHAQRGAAPNRRPCARWRRPGRGEPGTQGPCPARLAQAGAE